MAAPRVQINIQIPTPRFPVCAEMETDSPCAGIFGPSGSGKTTILEAIAGLRQVPTGRIVIDGTVLLDTAARICLPPQARGVGYVAQDGLLFPHMSVIQNVMAGATRAGSAASAPSEVMAVLDLDPLRARNVMALSGGEKQRVALARALCSGPRVLLLDEPLSSLDEPLRRRILPYLLAVRDRFRVPMIYVSHDPMEIRALCDDVVVLDNGAVVAHGPSNTILADPRVYPITEHTTHENLLRVRVKRLEKSVAIAAIGRLGGASAMLVIPGSGRAVGEEVLVGIRSDDIIVAREKPSATSARNLIHGIVRRVVPVAGVVLVSVAVADQVPELLVKLTHESVSDLQIDEGVSVFLIIKTHSCHPLGRVGDSEPL